eukprot:scaffold260996_cov33-Tisochrysis_lutea.AAC.6
MAESHAGGTIAIMRFGLRKVALALHSSSHLACPLGNCADQGVFASRSPQVQPRCSSFALCHGAQWQP